MSQTFWKVFLMARKFVIFSLGWWVFALLISLVFTAIGAGGFALIRTFEDRVPQEALIGITYAGIAPK